jgi:hypothetical protein
MHNQWLSASRSRLWRAISILKRGGIIDLIETSFCALSVLLCLRKQRPNLKLFPLLLPIYSSLPHAYIAIFSAEKTKNRLKRMSRTILSDRYFERRRFAVRVIVPRDHDVYVENAQDLVSNCAGNRRQDLCCRLRAAMDDFLESDIDWFVRAIDDSWFNLHNLEVYIKQLNSIVDPRRHVVVKGHRDPLYWDRDNKSLIQGGAPVLMSQAAVRHIARFFPLLCKLSMFHTDDNALALILQRTFSSSESWGDVHFAGPPYTGSFDGEFMAEWNENRATHFRSFNRSCGSDRKYWKPWGTMIGCHTNSVVSEWAEAVELAHSKWIPEDLMLEWRSNGHYGFCRTGVGIVRELTSVDYARAHTPLIELTDPGLDFSFRELGESAVRVCLAWSSQACRRIRRDYEKLLRLSPEQVYPRIKNAGKQRSY